MSPLLVALLGIQLIPLFLATWRASLLGLAAQGLVMALIANRMHPPAAVGDWLTLVDLAVVRGLIAPLALYRVLVAQRAPARNDVIPPNLLSWTLALGMVLVAFTFAEHLVPVDGDPQTLVAVATAGVLLGFLVLSTQADHLSQMIGALRIENALALLELGGAHHRPALGLQIALLCVFVATVGYFRWYLGALGPRAAAPDASKDPEGPSL